MYLGIDLGTSNSAVAGITNGQVKIFKTAEGTDTMPSVVHRDRRGSQTVGVRAYDQASLAPDNAIEGFKRLMGTDTPLKFASTGDSVTPEQAATEVLRALVGQALVESGAQHVEGAVVTIPAAFNQIQSEATLSAARAAGLKQVALLQEPVAAALAAMAGVQDRNGIFLVYDLGGGTFDAALVHALEGEITVLAHEGVNMLGGRDLDRLLTEHVVLPWLRRSFELPSDIMVQPAYRRLLRMARRAAEKAKILLSTMQETTISASDDEVRLEDLRGEPIYLDAPLSRSRFEELAEELVTRSVQCCRDMLAREGFRHEDVARVVLIGGPTKMPYLRQRVQDELGIQVEDISRVDPMTAVAAGAAIYCESRDWSASGSRAKETRASEVQGRTVVVSYDYDARTSSDTARLSVKRIEGADDAELLVASKLGWSSGRRSLNQPVTLDLPLQDVGTNQFVATVFGPSGMPIFEASREFSIERVYAQTAGVPATHTIAAKILDEQRRNTLDVLVKKGTPLPASGVVSYRLAEPLKAGGTGKARIELYQVDDERVLEPHLHLMVGEFQIDADDLPEAAKLRKGDKVLIHWAVSEGQEITAEVELPSVQQRFSREKFYNWQLAKHDFSGPIGGKFASSQVEQAIQDLENAEEAVPPANATALPYLRRRLDEQAAVLRGTLDPDRRRTVVEESRKLRQEIAVVCQQPDARRHLIRQRLARTRAWYNDDVRSGATSDQVRRVDTLIENTEAALTRVGNSEIDLASQMVSELQSLYWIHGLPQDSFCAYWFELERQGRHASRDPVAFDRVVAEGNRALESGDGARVRRALFDINELKISGPPSDVDLVKASIMRA